MVWWKYSRKEREQATMIEINGAEINNIIFLKSELVGILKIEGFIELQKIVLKKLKLTDLIIRNCPQLKKLAYRNLLLTYW